MSGTLDTFLNGVELTERVAGDIAHITPIFKCLSKRTSTAELLKLVSQVKEYLNQAGNILRDADARDALIEIGLYRQFHANLAIRHLKMRSIDTDVKTVKRFNIIAKYTIHARVVGEVQAARELKDDIWSKSNLSLLGFEFVDGELVAPVVPPPVPVVPPQQLPPAVPPVATPPAYTANDPLDDGDRVDDSLEPDTDSKVYSDTDSIFGNPWLGYVVEALAHTRLSTASLHSIAGAHLDNDEDTQ